MGILFTSLKWFFQQPTPDTFSFRVLDYIQQTVCSLGLKLAVVLDAQANPPWVLAKLPGAKNVDAWGNHRGAVSFSHPGALALVHAWQDAVLGRLAANNASCIHSIQPTRLTTSMKRSTVRWVHYCATLQQHMLHAHGVLCVQEGDGAQDYSISALKLFNHYLHSLHSKISYWNQRWATNFTDWAAVQPTRFFQHGENWGNTATDLLYWDWQHFRHLRLHRVHESCCQRVAAYGFHCIMHFPEVLTGSDAIYASGAVFTLAASPWLDYIIIDSNFMTTAMLPTRDVRVVQLLLSAMKPYGKQVFFEGAFERISDPEIHRRAVMLTATSGAHGIGFTNWLDRVGPTFFNDTLQGLPLPHSDAPPVAVLTPYRSYLAYKGTPKDANGVLFPTDPQQDRLFACLDEVEKELPSLDGLQIFGVPTMLLPVLQTFEQVWYVEPDVLLSGDASTIARIKERAGALGVPLRSCIKKKAPAIVLPECCPSM